MAIDPKDINSIEESMVHDQDEDPSKVKGVALYLTLRFISKVSLAVFGLMLVAMLVLQMAIRGGEKMPVSLSPESLLFAVPMALVAVYFYLVGEAEPEIEKRRTTVGRGVTFAIVFVVMQAACLILWTLTAHIFSLQ